MSPVRVGMSIGVLALISLLAWSAAPAGAPPWYAVLPPVIAVLAVVATRRLVPGMIAGILLGGVMAADFAIGPGLLRGAQYFTKSLSDSWNLQVLAFIPFMMGMIAVMIAAGGIQVLVDRLGRFSYGRKSAQLSTVAAGLIIFFDDYANTMVVGSGMRPLTDTRRVSRAKLAFLVDATSAPVAGLAVISTWIGYEVGLFNEVGTTLALGRDGFGMFLDALGFRFYCMMMVAFVLINAFTGRDFGPMLASEADTSKNPEATAQDPASLPHPEARRSAVTVFLPLAVLGVFLVGGLWLDGGGGGRPATDLLSLSAWRDVLMGVQNSVRVLLYAAMAGFLTTLLVASLHAKLRLRAIANSLLHSLRISVIPVCILILAWCLKNACDDLGAGKFLVAAIGSSVSPWLWPALVFLVSGLTSFATGTSWGTMAILIPTAIPVAFQLDGGAYGLVTMVSLGAVLDGSIFGDHCSPISDTTIMSSTASACDHLEHVRTQMPYALVVAGMALLFGYLPSTFGFPLWGTLLAAIPSMFLLMYVVGRNPEEYTGKNRVLAVLGYVKDRLLLGRSQPSVATSQSINANPARDP